MHTKQLYVVWHFLIDAGLIDIRYVFALFWFSIVSPEQCWRRVCTVPPKRKRSLQAEECWTLLQTQCRRKPCWTRIWPNGEQSLPPIQASMQWRGHQWGPDLQLSQKSWISWETHHDWWNRGTILLDSFKHWCGEHQYHGETEGLFNQTFKISCSGEN